MSKTNLKQIHYWTWDIIWRDKITNIVNVISFFGIKILKYLELGLKNHSETILWVLKTKISLERDYNYSPLLNSDYKLFLVSWKAWIWKSYYVKKFLESEDNIDYFIFRWSEFNIKSVNILFANYWWFTLLDFEKVIKKKIDKVYIVIDSAEQLLDIKDTNALHEFLSIILKLNVKIILTCRELYIDNINSLLGTLDNFLSPSDIINIEPLEEKDVVAVIESNNLVSPEDSKLFNLLKIPFYLNLFVEYSVDKTISYQDFREKVFDKKLSTNYYVRDTFEKLVLERVNNLNYYIKAEELKEENLNLLKEKWVIAFDKDRGYFITYDIYEEWGLEKYIDKKYNDVSDIKSFFKALWRELPMRRAFRTWMKDKLLLQTDSIKDILERTIKNNDIEIFWKDEVIVSVLFSEHWKDFLNFWKSELIKDDNTLLDKALLLTLITWKVTNYEILSQLFLKKDHFKNSTMFLKADWIIWDNIIDFIFNNKEEIKLSRNLLNVLKEYTSTNKSWETAKKCGIISIYYLTKIENSRIEHDMPASRSNDAVEILSKSVLAVAWEIKIELEEILDKYLNFVLKEEDREVRSSYFWEPTFKCYKLDKKPFFPLVKILLTSILDVIHPSIYIPEKIIKIFDYSIFWEDLKPGHNNLWDFWIYFWINERYDFKYFPSSAFQTPFYWLLKSNRENTIDFILDFNNKATKKYIDWLDSNEISEITLHIDWNEIKQYDNFLLYWLYRWFNPGLWALSSIHMWLEKYLLEYGKNATEEELNTICKKLLTNSISISTTAIVVSIAVAYPNKLKDILLILLEIREIFKFDLHRYTLDNQIHLQYWIGYWLNFEHTIYHDERLETCKEEHRKDTFESAIRVLQLNYKDTDLIGKINGIFDKHFEEVWDNIDYKFILNRTDLRKVNIKAQKIEDNQTMISFHPKDQKVIKESEKSLEKVNNSWKYLALSNYLNSKLVDINFQHETYNNFEFIVKELNMFLKDENIWEGSLLYRNLPIKVAYILIRDYYNSFQKDEIELFKNIIFEYWNNLLENASNRNYTPQIGDELIFYSFFLLLKNDKDNKDIKKIIIEILVSTNYYYVSENIFWNKHNYKPLNIFSVMDDSFIESMIYSFIYIRYIRNLKEKETPKIGDKYTFDLTTKELLEDYDIYINDFVNWNNETYKTFIFDKFYEIDDYILIYAFNIINKWHLDYIKMLSAKIFKLAFDRDEKIEYSSLTNFLDKYSKYILSLNNLDDIDMLLTPFLENINLKTNTWERLLSSLLFKQDISWESTYNNFWYIWQEKLFDKFIDLVKVDGYKFYEKDFIINYLFSWWYWDKKAKEWHTLKNKDNLFFTNIIKEIWDNKFVFYAIVRLLDSVWSKVYFNYGIDWISDIINKWGKDILNKFDEDNSVYKNNLIYYLENYIRKYLFIKNQEVRNDKKLKTKVLLILDIMVENGSSTAYLLRDNI